MKGMFKILTIQVRLFANTYKPPTAKVFYEDLLKMCVYYHGCRCCLKTIRLVCYFEDEVPFDVAAGSNKPGMSELKSTSTNFKVRKELHCESTLMVWFLRKLILKLA